MKRVHRILKNEQFQLILNKGTVKRTSLCYGYYYPNSLGILRVGIAVSKKIGNAPTRNKVKRQIRAIVRPYVLSKQGDFVFIAKKEVTTATFAELTQAIAKIFNQNGEKYE